MVRVTRSPDPPASLERESRKKSGSYREADVLERLDADFHGKCYLCEIGPLQSVEVEHLVPHQGGKRPEVKFDWDNLFLSCSHCNSIKNDAQYDGLVLDCCAEDPEAVLDQTVADGTVKVTPVKKRPSKKVKMTAQLLTACFEQRNTGVRTIECQTRFKELSRTMDLLYKTLEKYRKRPTARTFQALRGMLDRSWPFAGFTRTYVRRHLEDWPDLAELVSL